MNRLVFRACLPVFLITSCFLTGHARAASFTISPISGDNGYNVIGIDASGNALIESPFGCSAGDPNRCFELFTNGELVSTSDTMPVFTADNGSPCSSADAGALSVGRSVCNNGYQVAGWLTAGGPQVAELSPGSTGMGDVVFDGSADILFVNSSGDFVVTDGLNDRILQVSTVTPEPAAFILLGTAALSIVWLTRRRSLRAVRNP